MADSCCGALSGQGTSTLREPSEAEIDVPILRRYIAYAKKTCSPRLTEAAMETLQNYYVQIRQGLVEEDAEIERRGRAPRAVPITVRQLEAIIRISESVAKMRLSDIATEDDVQTAIHMFTVSTLRAAKVDHRHSNRRPWLHATATRTGALGCSQEPETLTA